MATEVELDEKRKECWNRALHAYGTYVIFSRRATLRRRDKRLMTYMGLLVPSLIGAIAIKFYSATPIPKWVIDLASFSSIIQFTVSLWALIAKWDDTASDAIQCALKNLDLQGQWEQLAREFPADFNAKFDSVLTQDIKQREIDAKQLATPKEKRLGMRAGLFQYQRKCAVCFRIPSSDSLPSISIGRRCNICGEKTLKDES